MMEAWPSILTGLTVVAAWVSLHRRMNGNGTIAQKSDIELLCKKLDWVAERVSRIEERLG